MAHQLKACPPNNLPDMKLLLFYVFFVFFCSLGADSYGASRVTLLVGHEQEAPWTSLLKEGLNRAKQDFSIEAMVVVAPESAEQATIFREVAKNSDLVLVSGESLHEILRDNASNFRRVMFGSIDTGIRAANIMSITFADQEAAFLAGVAAAMITGSTALTGINDKNIVGWLSGMDTPSMRTLYNGFEEGAKLVNPDITIAQALVGSFTNPELAQEKAQKLVDGGADVIVLAAGAGNDAANRVLMENKIWKIEVDKFVPDKNVIASITKRANQAVYEIIESFVHGNFQGKKILVYNLENGGVGLEGMEQFLARHGKYAPPALKRRLEEIKSELLKGSIHIRSLRTRTLCDCLD